MLVLEVVAVLLLLLALPLIAVAVRRRLLQRAGGTVDVSLRLRHRSHGRGWSAGLGRFESDELCWYRVFSVAPGPRCRLSRHDLEILTRRPPRGGEVLALLSGAVIVECASAAGPVHLAMDPRAVTGFLAWLEARPPGATLPR